MTETKKRSLLKKVLVQAKAKKRSFIIDMPEELDTAPHWLLWLALFALIGLVATAAWQMLATSNSLQAYLPFL